MVGCGVARHGYYRKTSNWKKDAEKFVRKLREFNEPLTLKEVAARLNMNEDKVAELIFELLKLGIVKAFFKENSKGELEAKYIIL
jgi:DNA-binding transcriptional regulator LsrR (DeoR family)